MLLDIQHLFKAFDGVRAVNDVCLSIREGTVTSITGPNGAGKTTLFNLIEGFLRQDSGRVSYKGKQIDGMRPSQRALLGIGRVWQDIRLFKRMTVEENLLVAKKNHPGDSVINCLFRYRTVSRMEKDNSNSAERILEFIKLGHKRRSLAQDLSYGQQKLLSLGRLLSNEAELLLVDEPTAGVSPVMVDEILTLIRSLATQGKTILMIEHNVPRAKSISDHVYVMNRGRVERSAHNSDLSVHHAQGEVCAGI